MPVGANPGPRADDRPPEGDPQPRRARRSRAGDTMTSSSAQLCRGCVGGPRLTAAHRKHLGRSSRPARIALSGRGRRELRIERRDSAVFRSGGRPVYRKAGRLTPPSSVEVGVVGRSHHRFYWSNRVLMQRLAPPTLSPCVSLWPPPPARRSNRACRPGPRPLCPESRRPPRPPTCARRHLSRPAYASIPARRRSAASRVPRGAADRHRPGRAGRKDGDRPDRVEGLIESFLQSRARSQDIGL